MSVSEGYVELTTPEAVAEARARLAPAWQDPSIPQQQRDLADRELAAWKAGGECAPFDAFAWALEAIRVASGPTQAQEALLDIGCASGYYSEVIQHIAGMSERYSYCGADYSSAMIDLARERYPFGKFYASDALALPWDDSSFDVVVSGCYLLHLGDTDWRKAIAEAVRVSKRWVVFHRTPLLYSGPTRHFTKRAYGVEVFEQHLAVGDVRQAVADAGLRVRFERQIARTGDHANETWVCERTGV